MENKVPVCNRPDTEHHQLAIGMVVPGGLGCGDFGCRGRHSLVGKNHA